MRIKNGRPIPIKRLATGAGLYTHVNSRIYLCSALETQHVQLNLQSLTFVYLCMRFFFRKCDASKRNRDTYVPMVTVSPMCALCRISQRFSAKIYAEWYERDCKMSLVASHSNTTIHIITISFMTGCTPRSCVTTFPDTLSVLKSRVDKC